MAIATFLFMNFIVITGSFFITYRLLKISNLIDSLICWFVFYFSQIIFSELVLGIPGILYLKNVILINLLILLIIWLTVRNQASSFNLTGIKASISELLKNKAILFGVSAILGFGLIKIFINLVNPPFGWDCLNYHFTFPVEWLKNGNLNNPIVVSDDPFPTYYPINGSLFFLWLILPLKNVFLADLGQIPFFILGFLAIYSLGRKININREYSFISACLFTLIPNYFKQMEIAYVDVMVSSLFFVALNFLLLLDRQLCRKNILLFATSLGLLLGTKTVALPYSILLFIPFIYLWFKNINKSHLFMASILLMVIFGGFTYIRNFIDTANPLYPLDVRLFGKDIFKGVVDNLTYRSHFKIEDYKLAKLLFHEGLGAQSLIFILPAVFSGLPLALFKKKGLNFNLIYFLILPILIFFVYRYIIPLANTRYLYPLLGVGTIIGFYLTGMLNIPKRIIGALAVICILASMAELAKGWELVISIILACVLFRIKPAVFKQSIFLLPVFLICSLVFLEKDYVRNEYPRYIKMIDYSGFWLDATRAWEWLNRNTTSSNIAYVGRPVPFPLYGSSFKNNVYYVSVNKTEPAKLHYFANSRYAWGYDFLSLHRNLEEEDNYRGRADYSVWLINLLRRSIDYLFIYSLHQAKTVEFPVEDKWAKDNPAVFTPAFTNDTIHIYKIFR